MAVVLITGASGLIGSEAARVLRRPRASTSSASTTTCAATSSATTAAPRGGGRRLEQDRARLPPRSTPTSATKARWTGCLPRYGRDIALVIHAAAQPSHDWAAREPITDFTVNANGTLNLLEMTRRHCPDAPFIFTSTNKVYGDTPNRLPLVERETRWARRRRSSVRRHGIDETMSIDRRMHSVFGASKVAADVMVQEYGRYFGLKTACFRGGCLTGPGHSGAELHGFLSYLVKCAVTGRPYTVFGYKGKQVRDNIHSYDLVQRVLALLPRAAERRGLQHRRRPGVELLDARGDRHRRAPDRPAAAVDATATPTAPATTSGGSATSARSPRTTRTGRSPTRSSGRSRRSTAR